MSNEENVVDVNSTVDLPKGFIPFHSVADAQRKFPGEKIYRYKGKGKGKISGWQIIAVDVIKTVVRVFNGE